MVAAAFGSVAIGGFWLARPVKDLRPLRLVEQWVPIVRRGADEDVAMAFRVDFRKGLRAAQDEGRTVEYRVIDRSGGQYTLQALADPNVPDGLKLQKGYARPILSPRLAAYSGEELLASVPLAPLPPPERVALIPRSDADLALVYHPGGGVFAEPKRGLALNERWRVIARRSPSDGHLDASAIVSPRTERASSRRLNVPYPWDVAALDVEIVRYRMVPHSEIVTVPNLRLERRFGGTALVVDTRTDVPNSLGASICLPVQDNGPRRPLRRSDPRVAFASLVVTRPDLQAPPPPGARREVGPLIEILTPSAESLGLKEIRIGGGVRRAKDDPTRSVYTGPFAASLRVTYLRPVAVGSRHAVIPVTTGSEMPRSRGNGLAWNTNPEF